MTKENKKKIRKLYNIGVRITEIAKLFNITANEVLMIVRSR